MYNEEEEIDRLIDEAADEYQPLDEVLKQNGSTFKEALSSAENMRTRFFDTLSACGIKHSEIERVCFDVVSLLKKERNDDVLFLYTSLLSERGLLFGDITDDEQRIRVWLSQSECAEYINERIKVEHILRRQFDALISHNPDNTSAVFDKKEQLILYEISSGHSFIAREMGVIYFENLQ